MDATWVVLLALVLGISMGAGFAVFVFAAVSRGERAHQVITPSVPDGVDQILGALESIGIVLDASDNVLKASQGALALGIVRSERIAEREVQEIADEVRRSGEPQTRRITLERARSGDATRILSVRSAPLGTRYVVVIANDLTESIRLDEVRRDFIANISHELKTPIGAISVLTEAISSSVDDPAQVRRFAEKMTTEADRLAALTADIINLSKLQADQALHMPERVSVDAIITSAVQSNTVVAESRRVTIATGEPTHLAVYGEEPLLVMALQNLVANAVQYSPDGSRVGVGSRLVGENVEISVTDQGVGIPHEDHVRVFERFYRLDGARSRHTGGTGLGLAIVKHTAQNHGGDVTVWSQPGQGSTFTLRLPVATGDEAVSTPVPIAEPERTQT